MNKNTRFYKKPAIAYLSLIMCAAFSCEDDPKPPVGASGSFETVAIKSPVTPGVIDEASGLAGSRNIAGHLWTTQDSNAPNSLFLISSDGKTVKEYPIPGTNNRDWEEVSSGPGPKEGVNYLYIGDIGNNNAPIATANIIYRVPEISGMNASFSQADVEKITFNYPDGAKNAESIIVDPDTKDIFILSKEAGETGIYRLPYPQSTSDVMLAEKTGTVPSVTTATAATISKDGSEILVRTYLAVHYWKRTKGQTIDQTIAQAAQKVLLVELEPQGEAVCFDSAEAGFFTLSEKSNSTAVTLNYYKRK